MNDRGFSLLEILIALGIVVVITAFGVTLVSKQPFSLMREQAGRLIQITRYCYSQAAAQSRYYRIVFDFEENTYVVESSEEAFTVAHQDEDSQEEDKSQDEETPPSSEGGFSETEDELLKVFKLDDNIKFYGIYVAHQKNVVSEGKVILYFFPRGATEFAVIYLSDEDDEKFMTLVLNPLNGKVEVFDQYIEYDEILEKYGEES